MRTYLALLTIALVPACADQDGGPTDGSLLAVDDELVVEMDGTGELDVADNDFNVEPGRTLAISEPPTSGTATLDDAGVLVYTPGFEFVGADQLRYTITNPDGTTAQAAVVIDVQCATCAFGTPITLAWDPSPPESTVLGFRLYLGPTEDPAGMRMVDDIRLDRPGLDPAMPSVTYDAWLDFRIRIGDTACFALTAYNDAGESGFSNAACKVVDGKSIVL